MHRVGIGCAEGFEICSRTECPVIAVEYRDGGRVIFVELVERLVLALTKPGDLVVWTPPAEGQHVALLVSADANPWLVSHGDDSGPKKIRFADEDAYQRRNGHGTPVYLSVF